MWVLAGIILICAGIGMILNGVEQAKKKNTPEKTEENGSSD